MPRFLVPHKSGPHRVACIALYRALLIRCSSLPIALEKKSAIERWIKQRFRSHRRQTSHELVAKALAVGYETHQLFGSSLNGSIESTNLILDNLAKLPIRDSSHRRATPAKSSWIIPIEKKRPISNVLDRPFQHLSGPRRVPRLVSANKIPFLALGKPQPNAITHMIRRKILQREELSGALITLDKIDQLAEGEDTWDMLTGRLGASLSSDIGWAMSNDRTRKTIKAELSKRTADSVKRAADLQQIVEQETELVRAEKEIARREKMSRKWQQWVKRKTQREEQD